jgi:hypothetical protein
MGGELETRSAELRFFAASHLEDTQLRLWREFANRVPWSHYCQDPAWAEVERGRAAAGVRQPRFFWVQLEGAVCLTALGVRRRLPVPRRVFWEFNKGPAVLDPDVLDAWLFWLMATRGRDVARMRVQPPLPLERGGDEAETVL